MNKNFNDTQIASSKHCELFKIVKLPNEKRTIVLGQYRLTKKEFQTLKDAEDYIASKDYEMLINLLTLMIRFTEYEKEQTKQENQDGTKEN